MSSGMWMRPASSIKNPRNETIGFRLIFSYAPLKSVMWNIVKVLPTELKSGVFCKLCERMFNILSRGNPSNAMGSIYFMELIEMTIICNWIKH